MTILLDRPNGCLSPINVEPVVDDPDHLRAIARASGPYFMPARYLIDDGSAAAAGDGAQRRKVEVPANLIGPVWRGDWVFNREIRVPEAAPLLDHAAFTAAAQQMCDAEVVVPQQVYVNLSGPMPGNAFSHVDIPEFIGVDRTNAPGWLLQAMGSSGLFEDIRITIVTAVAWFHAGERGFFRYWPHGRDADSIRHERLWNTAVVGDNDFMHHKVERIGPDGATPPAGMTIDTTLDHDGDDWIVVDDGEVLHRYADNEVRMSLSWKAKVYADDDTRDRADRGVGALSIDAVLDRFGTVLDEPLAATGPNALASTELRAQLTRFDGYRDDAT